MPTGDLPFVTTLGVPSASLTGQFGPGQTAVLTWTSWTKTNSGCGSYGYAVQIDTNGGDTKPEARFSFAPGGGRFELALTVPATFVEFNAFTDGLCSTGALHGASWSVEGVQGDCQYGTRKRTTSPDTLTLTQNGISQLLNKYEVPWLIQFLLQFAFQVIDVGGLCGRGPGAFPVIDNSSVDASVNTWRQVLLYLLWLDNCECIPGTPAPFPPPLPPTAAPPGWPTAPTFPCSNTDLCAAIVAIQQQLAALVAQQTTAAQLLTYLQRYQLPFAYIKGAVHSNIGQSGSFAISRLIGMECIIDTVPEQIRTLEGNPPYLWDLGWMSVLDGNGFIEEKRISHGTQIWTPRLMPEAITFGWFFKAGVTGHFTELEAEP